MYEGSSHSGEEGGDDSKIKLANTISINFNRVSEKYNDFETKIVTKGNIEKNMKKKPWNLLIVVIAKSFLVLSIIINSAGGFR